MALASMLTKIKNAIFSFVVIAGLACLFIGFAELIARAVIDENVEESRETISSANFRWDMINLAAVSDITNSESYSGYAWVSDFLQEREKLTHGNFSYDPFGTWVPVSGQRQNKYVTFNDEGFRHTPSIKKVLSSDRTLEIFFFGGSTLAGDGILRDLDLIPYLTCRELNEKLPDVNAKCSNYGVSGHNSDNELLLLIKLLKSGRRPDIVIFYDGINDAWFKGVQGIPHMRGHLFDSIISSKFRTEGYSRVRHRLAQMALDASVLLRYLTGKKWIVPPFTSVNAPSLNQSRERITERVTPVAENILNNYQIVRNLGKAYGFKAGFVLQPHLFSSTKPLSNEEAKISTLTHKILGDISKHFALFYKKITELQHTKYDSFNFLDLSSVFKQTKKSIFVDFMHVNPLGNEIISREMSTWIASELDKGVPQSDCPCSRE